MGDVQLKCSLHKADLGMLDDQQLNMRLQNEETEKELMQ